MMEIENFNLDDYQPIPVIYELRQSILEKIKSGEEILTDIDGREETKQDVIRAILSGANPYLVSEEGTGKTRLARSLTKLLSSVPVINGCPYHDDPKWGKEMLCPRCAESEDPVDEFGIDFISGDERFSRIQGNEYTNYAKILGLKDIEAIRVGVSPTDPRAFTGTGVFHANRGILFIDEFPSIPTNVQLLFHPILEEGKVILEEYNLEQPVDILMVATGNPEGFAHVNRIPSSILDSMELIHMDLPEEDVERKIMRKEMFKFDPTSPHKGTSSEPNGKSYTPNHDLLDRRGIVPWWISHIVSKTVDFTRYCANLDRGASVWGAKKAIDHTYASLEMRGGQVANLRDASEGLKLALRGRIRIRADLVDFGEDPKESFKKIDVIIEDILRHATKNVGSDFYELLDYGKGVAQEINKLLLDKKVGNLLKSEEIRVAIDKMFKIAPKKIDEDLLSTSEKTLILHPEKFDEGALYEYDFSALEILVNTGIYKGFVDENSAKRDFFVPEVF
ncbi:MAG: hypothetical protein SVM80_00810 [Halobacteriota archaeon]|nr:hypothetical protein [Halobacteriota archaeon]